MGGAFDEELKLTAMRKELNPSGDEKERIQRRWSRRL